MKKTAFLTLAFLATALCAGDLSLQIENIKSKSGSLDIAIYKDAKSFNSESENTFVAISMSIFKDKMQMRFNDFPKGEYAICIQQDVNKNGKLDASKNKIPTEPYACSNGAGKTSAPTFKNAKFTISDENKIIKLDLIQPKK